MTDFESAFCDLVRSVAALVVLVGHVVLLMPGAVPLTDHGHQAVIAFFVLSGYVIAFVTTTRETTARDYVLSRAARLYSVAVPAILLTLLCDSVGLQSAGRAIYDPYPGSWPVVRAAAALSFTAECWFLSIQPFSNGPYWSLCYEVWYYAIFAAWHYLTGYRRLLVAAVLCGLAGPKILALFPVWLLGLAVYRWQARQGTAGGALLMLGAGGALIALVTSGLTEASARMMRWAMGEALFHWMSYASNFPADYAVGLLVAACLVGAGGVRMAVPLAVLRAIRWAAGATFSIYLFHRPVIFMLLSVATPEVAQGSALALVMATVAITVVLSYATERRKQAWRTGCRMVAARLLPR